LHSGNYGNWAPNPGMRLAQLLASMKDGNGNVLIDGFYDDVLPLTENEKAAIAKIPRVESTLQEDLALGRPMEMEKVLWTFFNCPHSTLMECRAEM